MSEGETLQEVSDDPDFKSSPTCVRIWGRNCERYQSVQDLQQYSGTAPVVKASGKVRLVQRRFARPPFLHQSFIEYSDQSVRHYAWAKAFYRSQRSKLICPPKNGHDILLNRRIELCPETERVITKSSSRQRFV
jgi:hypothetical protein